ncbi:RHS repeat-associated core domain-containing protein [Amycolatopsis sp. NPDC059657]|uniref:RHS repeat-associated core domain-containing protein n=1 Tax=Amycolatopsis sp. NPDC059657 TaxID=3346899 RepID=UPI003670ECBA
MPEGNPLVAKAQSQTTGVTGIGIAESAVDLANGVKDGSWVEGGLGALGVGLEVLSLALDPIGTLAQYGVSWLIEHVQPLKEALDWLAGNPPVIQSYSDTWANVAKEVNAIAGDMNNEGKTGTAGWQGAAAEAYRGEVAEQADAIVGAATLADGISTGVMVMGQVVAMVRETVRDLVAELVGKLITWALEEACTLGFATPLVAAQATAAITKAISKVSDLIRKLVKTIGNVAPKIRKIVDKLGEIIEKLSKLGKKLSKGGGTSPSAAKAARKTDAPDLNAPKGDTTPSSAHSPDSPDSGTTPSSTKTDSPDTTHPSGTGAPGAGKSPGGKNGDADPSMKKNSGDPKTEARKQECVPGSGDPIDLATGQMFTTQVDVELRGVLPLVLQRTHFSEYRVGRLFGRSWTSTLDQRVEVDEDSVYFAGQDGIRLIYPAPATDGTPVFPREGPRWPLARTETGYVVTDPATGRELQFGGGAGLRPLTAIVDRNGNRIDVDHDPAGIPVGIRHSGGYHLGVDSEAGLVTAIWLHNPVGEPITLVRYRYNDARQLTEVLDPEHRAMRFDYDADGRVTRWEDRNGEWYRYHYDADGRCVRTEGSGNALAGSWNYDPGNRVTVYTDSLGNSWTYHFNEFWQAVREIDPLGRETHQLWDRRDQLLSYTDPLGNTTGYEYDSNGNQTAITLPDGTRSTAEFGELGLPVAIVDADGAVWRREYDAAGNLVAVTEPGGGVTTLAYDERGFLSSVTDALGNTQRIRTNDAGLVVEVTDALGATTRHDRDQFGRVMATTDPLGNTIRLAWTVGGRLISRTSPDGAVERWRYDGEGNKVEHVDALGRVSRIETTHFDLPAAEVRPDGSRLEFSYDSELRMTAVTNEQGLVWRYAYNPVGDVVEEVDFSGRRTTYDYDQAGRLIARTNGAGQTLRLARDAVGNIVEQRSDDGAVATFEFDAMGRLTRAVNADADLVFDRDRLGRVLSETVNGRTLTSRYDPLGRRVHRRTPTGAESVWEYNGNDQVTTLHTAGRSLHFGYDSAGREVERLVDTGTIQAQTWDAADRLTSQTISSVTGGRADPTRRPRLIQQRQYRYQPGGHLSAVEDRLAGTRWYQFDQAGRVHSVRRDNSTETYSYDPAGNLTSASWPGSADAGPREYSGGRLHSAGNLRYSYDAQGRVVLRQKKRLSAKPAAWRYSWDANDRLTAVVTPDGTRWRYRYDPLGRRIAKQRYADDGMTVVEQVDFTWDGGVLTEQTTSSGSTTTWNWELGGFRPVTQVERSLAHDATQEWVDREFYSIVTDLIGTPTELVDAAGELAWHAERTIWGAALSQLAQRTDTPLRFPGQYYDAETGLHYNYQRYYDPESGRYHSADPLGLAPDANPYVYVHDPTAWTDPLGLARRNPKVKKCPPAEDLNWNPNSGKTFGHALNNENGHGARRPTQDLVERANSQGKGGPQGRWTDNDQAAQFLREVYDPNLDMVRTVPLPEGLGSVIMPDGSILQATHALLKPSRIGGAYHTAYPIIPGAD